jgi:hypothetical protein
MSIGTAFPLLGLRSPGLIIPVTARISLIKKGHRPVFFSKPGDTFHNGNRHPECGIPGYGVSYEL